MPYRYHRLYFFAKYPTGLDRYITAAEIAFRSTPGGPNLALGGAVSASSSYSSSNLPAKAVDGNTSTNWSSDGSILIPFGQWFQWDTGAGNEVDVVEYAYRGSLSSSERLEAPVEIMYRVSNDGVTWTTLDHKSNLADFTLGEIRTFPVSGDDSILSTSYQILRIKFNDTQANEYAAIGEVYLLDDQGNRITTGGTASASSAFGGSYTAAKALDGSLGTDWCSVIGEYNSGWWQYDFGAGNNKSIRRLGIGAATTSDSDDAPTDFTLQGSNDGVEFHDIQTFTAANWSAGLYRLFTVTSDSSAGPSNQPVVITQLPVLVVDSSNQDVRVSQLPILVVQLPIAGVNITQLPLLVPVELKPIPLPGLVVPEVPVSETWSFKTVVGATYRGLEQRSSIRQNPRIRLEFDAIILDDSDREAIYSAIYHLDGKEFLYPAFQYSVTLTSKALAGSSTLSFDATKTDVRVGESVAVFDTQLGEVHYFETSAVDDDGATLVDQLPFDVPSSWMVCPAYLFRFLTSLGLTMQAISGKSTLRLESTRSRTLERVSGNALLTKYNGRVVLDKRPLGEVEENFDRSVDWLDNDTAIPESVVAFKTSFVSSEVKFIFDRLKDTAYWRAFAAHCNGRQETFLLPTFRDDLPLAQPAVVGTKQFVTTNLQAYDMMRYGPYDYGLVETTEGSFYCRLLDSKINYDDGGDPQTLTVSINEVIDAPIVKVSFAYTARLDDDDVELEHGDVDTLITLPVRTVVR